MRSMTSALPVQYTSRAPRHFRLGSAALSIAVFGAYIGLLYWLEGPPGGLLRAYDPLTAQLLANMCSRASVALISTVFASLFLAIPLTASMYTPQLIEIFVRSWTNRLVLGLFLLSAGHAIWLGRMVANGNVPVVSLMLSQVMVLLSVTLLLPYLFYVFRFLDPDTIINRVAAQVIEGMHPNPRLSNRARQAALARSIHHLGNIILRALDRADRDVALAAVDALGRCAAAYFDLENKQPEEWFTVDSRQFPGLSREAVDLLNREHTWVEMELLRQLSRAYEAALAKMPDVLSAISRIDRRFAITASTRGDEAALRLALRFFNNFLREAIKRKDLRAVFDVLYQYRQLAIALWDTRPALVVEMARHLDYYGRLASNTGIPFAHDLIAYDLGAVLAHAAEHEQKWLDRLLRVFLRLRKPGAPEGPAGLSLHMFKARLILTACLTEHGHQELAEVLENSLRGAPADLMRLASEDLLGEVDEWFWEVTDRQLNLDYLRPNRKACVRELLERLEAPAGSSG